jgi:hypothetical protein
LTLAHTQPVSGTRNSGRGRAQKEGPLPFWNGPLGKLNAKERELNATDWARTGGRYADWNTWRSCAVARMAVGLM